MEPVIGASHGFNLKAKRDLHPNIWSHDFIQCLRSPFLKPHYENCTKTLIKDVNMYLQQIFQECKESQDVNKLLCTIDELMCLGVDRHFEEQIKQSLDLLHHIWKSQNGGIAHNLNSAALAFTLLRLNRFPNISSECFGKLKNENGGSFLPAKEEYSSEEVNSVLNLLRASQIQYPEETALQEAETYATSFLKSWLKSQKNPCSFMHLINKVKYCLEYPWISNTPRWEARNFIDFHESDEKWMGVKENAMIMQLAKLDYNRVQACHQKELKLISKWWMESPISKTGDLRERPTEAYFVASCIFHQPEFEVARITMAKLIKSDEKKHGDVVSAISCYMDENPHLTTEEALEQLRLKHREVIKEVAKLYLSSNEDAVEDDSLEFKRAVFETTRAVHFMFTHGDGFTVSDGKVRDQINAALIEPLQVDSPAPL